MERPAGVYFTKLKNGTASYRCSITIGGRHISLGSYDNAETAGAVYSEAGKIFHSSLSIDDYSESVFSMPFYKYVILVNYRDNNIYFKTPVYLENKHFTYWLSPSDWLIFDTDDLFYYTTHSIMRRGSHLFVSDFGMQVNILSRYGIPPHAVAGRDYVFANGNNRDYRYSNINIINPYHGVFLCRKNGRDVYKTRIHINGDYVVGTYDTDVEAAIAYNKAADILRSKGIKKSFPENYPESLDAIAYASIYNSVKVSRKILDYQP